MFRFLLCCLSGDYAMKKKLNKRTKFVILASINLIWFAIATLIINSHGYSVSGELVVSWYAAWTVELALLAGIQIKGRKEE